MELTPSEQRILELLKTGKTNREIGAALFISHHTVKVYVSRILSKYGAVNRTQLVSLILMLEQQDG